MWKKPLHSFEWGKAAYIIPSPNPALSGIYSVCLVGWVQKRAFNIKMTKKYIARISSPIGNYFFAVFVSLLSSWQSSKKNS